MVGLLMAAGHLAQALETRCLEGQVTYDQYNVLLILRDRHPHALPRFEIARRLIRRAPDVTRLLDRLGARGLVERSKSRDDARLSLATITESGLALLEGLEDSIMAVHERFAAGLDRGELQTLFRLLNTIIEEGGRP